MDGGGGGSGCFGGDDGAGPGYGDDIDDFDIDAVDMGGKT